MADIFYDIKTVSGNDVGWFFGVSFERSQEICKKYLAWGFSCYVYDCRPPFSRCLVSKYEVEHKSH